MVRKIAWFSYLDAEDIRTDCHEGTIDRYRFVYNARYEEQLRGYEITGDAAGGGDLVARAIERANPRQVSLDDLFEPWRWRKSEQGLAPAELASVRELLLDGAMYAGAPVGPRLFSGDFYWLGAAGEAGVFHHGAWLYPGDRYDAIRFPKFLLSHARTGLAIHPPRLIPAAERIGARGRRDDQTEGRFWLQVEEDGLGGLPRAY